MWKPGYADGPAIPAPSTSTAQPAHAGLARDRRRDNTASARPPVSSTVTGVQQIAFDAPASSDTRAPVVEPGRSRRGLAVVALIVAALVIGGVVVSGRDDPETDRPDVGEIVGADPRRLPERVDALWATTLNERRLEVGRRDMLIHERSIVTVLDGEDEGSAIVALEVDDGSVRWRRSFDFLTPSTRLLGVFDDLVVVEQNDVEVRRLFAVDLADGSTRWELPTADNGIHVAPRGTKVIARVSFTGNERLTFVDPATGDEVARLEGRTVSSDLSGTWYVANNRRIVSVDLVDGWSEPIEVVASGAQFDEPLGVVAGRVLVMDDGILSEVSTVDGQRTPVVVQPFGNDVAANSLFATGESSFIAVGDGRVLGASLDDDAAAATIEWTRPASLRDGAITEQGMVISVVTDEADPPRQLVLDALTGETIVDVAQPESPDESPQILRDGVVVTNSDLGLERVGYDFDGNEQWRLAAPGTMRLGDRVLVTLEDTPDGYRISAFGDRP